MGFAALSDFRENLQKLRTQFSLCLLCRPLRLAFRTSYSDSLRSSAIGLATRLLLDGGALCLFGRKSLQKLGAGCLHIEGFTLHPGVSSDLLYGWALSSIVREELQDEVLEVFREIGAIDLGEVSVGLTRKEQVVEIFFLAGLLEWEDTLHDDEEDDSDGEHIDLLTGVSLALLDLRGHVGHGTSVRP